MLVWFAKVEREPEATVTVSPHPTGYVVYVNDPAEYYEVWKSGDHTKTAAGCDKSIITLELLGPPHSIVVRP